MEPYQRSAQNAALSPDKDGAAGTSRGRAGPARAQRGCAGISSESRNHLLEKPFKAIEPQLCPIPSSPPAPSATSRPAMDTSRDGHSKPLWTAPAKPDGPSHGGTAADVHAEPRGPAPGRSCRSGPARGPVPAITSQTARRGAAPRGPVTAPRPFNAEIGNTRIHRGHRDTPPTAQSTPRAHPRRGSGRGRDGADTALGAPRAGPSPAPTRFGLPPRLSLIPAAPGEPRSPPRGPVPPQPPRSPPVPAGAATAGAASAAAASPGPHAPRMRTAPRARTARPRAHPCACALTAPAPAPSRQMAAGPEGRE